MKWISVEERLPDYDQYVTWKQADGMTFYADIDHDSSFDYLQKSCNAHAIVNLGGIPPSEESVEEAKERVRITHWLDESEPVPNPMIEGEGKEYWKWVNGAVSDEEKICRDKAWKLHGKAVLSKTPFDMDSYMAGWIDGRDHNKSSQPIVKGDGETENTSWPFVNTSRWPDLSKLELKPDGIDQGEKGHNQAIADIIKEIKRSPAIVSEQKYNEWYKRLLALTQPKALPDVTEWECPPEYYTFEKYTEWLLGQPSGFSQAYYDGKISAKEMASEYPPTKYFPHPTQSHPKAQPQAGKDRSKEEILEKCAGFKFTNSAEQNLLNAMQEWGDQEVAKALKNFTVR